MVHNIIITQQGWTDVKVETSLPNWSIRGLRFRCNEVQDTAQGTPSPIREAFKRVLNIETDVGTKEDQSWRE